MSIKINNDTTMTILVDDPFNGLTARVEMRWPTLDETLQFGIDSVALADNEKMARRPMHAAVKNLPPLIKGVEFPNPERALLVEGKDGKDAPLSSKKGDPGYQKDWYQILERYMSKALVELAARAYVSGVDVAEVGVTNRPN